MRRKLYKHIIDTDFLGIRTKIKNFVKQNPNIEGIDYIEQTTRIKAINLLTGIEFKAMIEPDSIYSNYNNFFKNFIFFPTIKNISMGER